MKKTILTIITVSLFLFVTQASAKPLRYTAYIGTAESGVTDGNGNLISGNTTVLSGTSGIVLQGNGLKREESATILTTEAFEHTNWTLEVSAATPSQARQGTDETAGVSNYSNVSFSIRARTFNFSGNRTASKSYPIISNMPLTSANSPYPVSFELPWAKYTEFLLVTGDVALDGFNATLIGNISDSHTSTDRVYAIDLAAQSGTTFARGSGVSHIGTVNLSEIGSPGYVSLTLGTVNFSAAGHTPNSTGDTTNSAGVSVTVSAMSLDEDDNRTSAEIETLAVRNIGALSKVSDFVLGGDTVYAINVSPASTRGKIAFVATSSVTDIIFLQSNPPKVETNP